MSTEKLSKPVAWIIGEESIEEFKRGYETFVVRGDDVDSTEETMKLYSQEYVSAILAELEVQDKRIAELERSNTSQDDHINQQQDRIDSLEKTNAGLGQRLGAAEKRLATPVRLPAYRNSPDMHTKQYYEAIGFNQAIDACEVSVSGAGFTVGNE